MWRVPIAFAVLCVPRACECLQMRGVSRRVPVLRSSRPDFLEDALGDASTSAAERAHARRPLLSPLGGVSVSARGFVAMLTSSKDESPQRALPVVIHRSDVEGVTSPWALTILQLMEGIDVATAQVLPPNALGVARVRRRRRREERRERVVRFARASDGVVGLSRLARS